MCLQKSSVAPWDSWNWAGDQIIPTPIIRASRPIPGTKKRYNIDIREFLTTINNAVVHDRLDKLIHTLPANEQALFRSHSRNSFDLRADRVVGYVSQLKYMAAANVTERCPDAWLFPDETLSQGGGDCEDLALLLAALLIAAGISSYCVRVALGSIHLNLRNGTKQRHDHCWVMYQNEAGIWEILEPLHVVASPGAKAKAVQKAQKAPNVLLTQYIPHYVFNTDHLWLVDSDHMRQPEDLLDYCQKRAKSFWNRFDPSFAAGVHSDIFDAAFNGVSMPSGAMSAMKRKSLWLDVNLATYDPRDHFDNAFIEEGWAKVQSNLDNFKADRSDWSSMGAAGHSIADFYAHSSYCHFAPINSDGSISPYDPAAGMPTAPTYTATQTNPSLPAFDLTSGHFSTNPDKWQGTGDQRAALWAGKLISGRYAQLHDPKAGFWEGFTSIPKSLTDAPNFNLRGSLPHHNEIAVDQVPKESGHILYNDPDVLAKQFNWRKKAAIQHIATAYSTIVHGG